MAPEDEPTISPSSPFELLEHPADVKLRARGATLQELFTNAAAGMMTYLFGEGIAERKAEQTQTIAIEGRDREALLVDFLSELLYRATSQYRAYVDFSVREMTDRKIVVAAGVVPAQATDDIKAVTHHELAVRRQGDHWEATVVLDI
jgi:protein archease